MTTMAQEAMQAAYTAWLAEQDQISPCQEAAFLAGWRAALRWEAHQRWEELLRRWGVPPTQDAQDAQETKGE